MDVCNLHILYAHLLTTVLCRRNIWGPNKQQELVTLLAKNYKFSPRLLAVIKSAPPTPQPRVVDNHISQHRAKTSLKDDVEANSSFDTSRQASSLHNAGSTSHYDIAKKMKHFQSIDVGAHCELGVLTEIVSEY